MLQLKDDLSRSLVALDQDRTLIAVVELSLATWLVGGVLPGIQREPLKKLPPDPEGLLKVLHRWREEAAKAGHKVARIVVAFEAGRDGFWLARWLQARGIEAYVIHPTSVAVSREQRRAKTDRLDIALLKRSFLGWLRGEKKHCTMVAIPTLHEEDAKRPTREREQLVGKRTGIINRMKAALVRLGIRGFNVKLRKAPEQLATLLTPEGHPIPTNTLAELRREMAHLRFIDETDQADRGRPPATVETGAAAAVECQRFCNCNGSSASAPRPRTCSHTKCCRATYAITVRSPDTLVSRAHPTKVVRADARRGSRRRAMLGSVVA